MPLSGFKVRGNRRLADILVDSLGDLEKKVMLEVQRGGSVSVADVCAGFDHAYAYTTVMTTLDRLYKKGLLERRKEGRAYFYELRFSAEDMEREATADIIGQLLDSSLSPIAPVLACIVESISERDLLLLDELERLVRQKRSELGDGAQ
jgi:predicted transcriptional regulator